MTKLDPSHKARLALLEAALPHVPFDGWTSKALKQAVRGTGLPVGAEELYFPGGALEMIEFWNAEMDAQVEEKTAKLDLANMRIRDKVSAGVLARLYAISGKTSNRPHGLTGRFVFGAKDFVGGIRHDLAGHQ